MKNAYIKFLTDEDRQSGIKALSSIDQFITLNDEVFCVPVARLRLLDEANVGYTHASNDDVSRTSMRTWRFAHS
jgi:hypothetical protein